MAHQSFFSELRRRHVFRVAIAYVVTAWLLLQLAAILFPAFGAPHWAIRLLFAFFVLGFPVSLLLAWAFESTPEGVRRTVPADSEEARPEATTHKLGRKIDFLIIGVLVAAVGVLAWRLSKVQSNTQFAKVVSAATSATPEAIPAPLPRTAISAKSIAVLPFENLSEDKNNGYFADGMQDLILTKLADIGNLKVISRTSTMKYGSHPENLQTVGKQLGVATILEGSVQKAGDQVLINVQLIDARSDSHIWANSYTRTLKNVFSVEGEVASKIASTLNAKLSPAETKRLAATLSGNTQANDLYLRGEYFTNHANLDYDTKAYKQAITFYRKAIALAPDFAQARAKLSLNEGRLAWFGGGGDKTAPLYADALKQARQALQLAPKLADAHLALGYYEYYGKGDYAAALKAFGAALALRPNDSDALAARAYVLRRQAKFNVAIDALKQALALDPRNSSLASETGSTYMMASRYPAAERAFQQALAIDPNNFNAQFHYIASIVLSSGDVARALSVLPHDNANPRLKLVRVYFLQSARRYAEALKVLESIPDTPDNFSTQLFGTKSGQLAFIYDLMGDKAKARALYAEALPQARAQYRALEGSPATIQSFALFYVAQAQIGLGRTAAGVATLAKMQAMTEHSANLIYESVVTLKLAEGYAYADRADKAVPLLAMALRAPGIGYFYSPVMLWLDPSLDPIRKTPAFQALLKQYAKYRRATVPKHQTGSL